MTDYEGHSVRSDELKGDTAGLEASARNGRCPL